MRKGRTTWRPVQIERVDESNRGKCLKEGFDRKIEVIGPGCPFCRRLYRRVEEVVRGKGVEAQVLHVTDLRTALQYFPRTPVLLVDGRIVHKGKRLPAKERVAELLGV